MGIYRKKFDKNGPKTDDNGNAMLQSFIPRTDHYIDNVDPFLGPIW